ncbi:hypothetical protein CBR_g39898 [Chara braunii]|uniref:CCHC-type domain-containing protein n=1 Tax=Chara braunii TaxID=69332 RepID=A0A388LSU2_CHABU|nr:hypothetical protein CBR_g39898 [Chara braunii]|eukprot:GBG85331.1 hypothetical protein CBR_g39898 [Chara braunii]
MADEGELRQGNGANSGLPSDGRKCYKCGEGGYFIREFAEFWQAKALGRTFVPSTQATKFNMSCTGRVAPGASIGITTRHSRSADIVSESSEGADETNALMREYFVQMAEERRARIEREVEEDTRRREEEVRMNKEKRRMMEQEVMRKRGDEMDARLVWIIRGEIKKKNGEEERVFFKGKRLVKNRCDTIKAETKRLRWRIANAAIEDTEGCDDEELITLRKHASKLELAEKRKRGLDLPIGNNPPLVTLEKRSNKAIRRIQEENRATQRRPDKGRWRNQHSRKD